MRRFAVLLLALLALFGCTTGTQTQVRVVQAIDGDTIEIAGGFHVRYIGIDAPELYPDAEYYGAQAWAKNRELVEGKIVTLRKDVTNTDRYGRLLRYVYVDGLFVNAELVRLGYAEAFPCPPDIEHQELFSWLEREARDAKKGLWK